MAHGDVKPITTGGRGGWGGGSSYSYDDEGRGASKDVWEWFELNYGLNDYQDAWLTSIDQPNCYWLYKSSTYRYGLEDIASSDPKGDSRAHRLVLKKSNEAAWLAFHAHLIAAWENEKRERELRQEADSKKYEEERAAYEAKRKAEKIIVDQNDVLMLESTVTPTVGMLESEFNQVLALHEQESDSGDWIEDVTNAYIGQDGFGVDAHKAKGIKLQITLSLDLSNSMYYNSVHKIAATVFQSLGMTLKELQGLYPEDLYLAFFTFSKDTYNGYGQRVSRLVYSDYRDPENVPEVDKKYAEFRDLRPSVVDGWYREGMFDGHDTYIAPLFKEIEQWENANSDAGAIRLDVVLTDAVLEHKQDIKDASVIQERRNGNLQTLFLNFMPEKEWVGSTLPRRCIMMAVDKDNVAGILRNVLSEFVGANL